MAAQPDGAGKRIAFFAYGAVAYLLFLVAFLYLLGFLANWMVPKSIDSGTVGSTGVAILVNTLLIALLGVQHTIMARPRFKARWTKIVPKPIERSTYVLITNLIFFLMFWQWRPMSEIVWSVESQAGQTILWGMFAAGWALVLYASFCIDHFDLFGLRQVYLYLRGKPYTHPGFATPKLYRLVRNPLMLGWFIVFWSTPVMTQGHLLFAIVTTAYGLIGIAVEERDLLSFLGEDYRRYRAQTPMLLPWPRPPAEDEPAPAPGAAEA